MPLLGSLSHHYGGLGHVRSTQRNRLLLWGHNEFGQAGRNTSPVVVPGDVRPHQLNKPETVLHDSASAVRQYALGGWHTLVLLADGQLLAFGSNDVGQLGIRLFEAAVAVPRPVAIPAGVRIAHIACGHRQSAAVSVDGRVYLWGGGVDEALGLPMTSPPRLVTTPTLVSGLSSVVTVSVACGGAHTLFVSATGAVFAAGSNVYGQCGVDAHASTGLVRLARAHFGGDAVHHVAAGEKHSAALTASGAVYCWGDDSQRQCAGALTGICSRPRSVDIPSGGAPIVSVACGRSHCAALDVQGRLWTWGDNNFRQLGRAFVPNVHPIVGVATGGEAALHTQTVRSALIALNHTVLLTWEGDVVQFGVGGPDMHWNVGMPNPYANTYGFVAFGAVVDSAPPYWLAHRTLPLNCLPRDRVVNILESVALLREEAQTARMRDDTDGIIEAHVALAQLCARSGIAALMPLAAEAIDAAAQATEVSVQSSIARHIHADEPSAARLDVVDESRESDVAALARVKLVAALLNLRRGDTYRGVAQLCSVADLLPAEQMPRLADAERDETTASMVHTHMPVFRSRAAMVYGPSKLSDPNPGGGSSSGSNARSLPLATTTGLARYFLARAAWRAGEWDAASQRLLEALNARPGDVRTRAALYTIMHAKQCLRQQREFDDAHAHNDDDDVDDDDDNNDNDNDDDDDVNIDTTDERQPAAEQPDDLFAAYTSAYSYELAFPETPRPAAPQPFDSMDSFLDMCNGDLLHGRLVLLDTD
jgi:alpha-tubulin suppressor-like RCC1 family protein